MPTYFCPGCWRELAGQPSVCPGCGYDLSQYGRLTYPQKLVLALRHPLREQRLVAVRLLGELDAADALPAFAQALATENDPYLLQEILTALAKMHRPGSRKLLTDAAHHPSRLVRERAARLLERLPT